MYFSPICYDTSFNNGQIIKTLHNQYKVNLDFLDIFSNIDDWIINGEEYELNSFVIHQSTSRNDQNFTMDSGHYTSCIRRSDGWYFCDDEDIYKLGYNKGKLFEKIYGGYNWRIPYLFFLQKKGILLRDGIPYGIQNPSNICFMNATMQCLMNLPIFNTFIENS